MTHFLINEFFRAALLYSSAFLLGLWVLKGKIRVNYTRKILHFILFFVPIYLASIFPFESSIVTVLASGCLLLLLLGLLAKPLRDRFRFLAIAYAAVDRPEDRPYTLIWMTTQVLATYCVLVLMLEWLAHYDAVNLIYITILVAALGDGLAEPVGIRFGKHEYSTSALFTNKKYVRTIEGSLCVFFSAILAIALLYEQLTGIQIVLAILVIPFAMTLAEAWSPHTWDGPFLYLVGGGSTVAVLEMSRLF